MTIPGYFLYFKQRSFLSNLEQNMNILQKDKFSVRDNDKNHELVVQCGVQGCCPVLKMSGKAITITDDYGGVVKMTKEQWNALVTGFRAQGEKN